MQIVLVMFRADGERRSFSITRDVTLIGRREDCDLRIPLGDISRKHCRLVKVGDSLRLEDLGSSNGTYRNGQRIQKTILDPGDTLQIGPVIFVLQIDGVPADDELQPLAPIATNAEAGEVPAAGDSDVSPGMETLERAEALPALDEANESEFNFMLEEASGSDDAAQTGLEETQPDR